MRVWERRDPAHEPQRANGSTHDTGSMCTSSLAGAEGLVGTTMPSSPKMEVNYCIIAMTSQATAMTVKSFHVVTVTPHIVVVS